MEKTTASSPSLLPAGVIPQGSEQPFEDSEKASDSPTPASARNVHGLAVHFLTQSEVQAVDW